jgi:hypothetical protein
MQQTRQKPGFLKSAPKVSRSEQLSATFPYLWSYLVWPWGINNFRIQYTAGFPTIPEAVQLACALWVSNLWYNTQRDPSLQALAVSGAITQTWQPNNPNDVGMPPQNILPLLKPYRRYVVATGQA